MRVAAERSVDQSSSNNYVTLDEYEPIENYYRSLDQSSSNNYVTLDEYDMNPLKNTTHVTNGNRPTTITKKPVLSRFLHMAI